MKNKEISELVQRLHRIFPRLKFFEDGYYMDKDEDEYAPPIDLNWFDVIEELKKNGLEIRNIKETHEN